MHFSKTIILWKYLLKISLIAVDLLVSLFNRSLHVKTHLDPDGPRLKQNAQARLKVYKVCWPSGLWKYKERETDLKIGCCCSWSLESFEKKIYLDYKINKGNTLDLQIKMLSFPQVLSINKYKCNHFHFLCPKAKSYTCKKFYYYSYGYHFGSLESFSPLKGNLPGL